MQVYTGKGKGKTTAALGLALRAAGAGIKVYIGQFAKGMCYSELNSLKKLKNITIEQFGRRCFIKKKPDNQDVILAKQGLKKIEQAISARKYGLVIMDEINVAVKLKLLPLADVIRLIKSIPKKTELVLTGRFAHPEIIKLADLVSEIKDIKHYYKKGVKARRGIEC